MSTITARRRRPRSEDNVDEAIAESFPASDPPAFSRTAGPGAPPRAAKPRRIDTEQTAPDAEEKTR